MNIELWLQPDPMITMAAIQGVLTLVYFGVEAYMRAASSNNFTIEDLRNIVVSAKKTGSKLSDS